MNTWLEIGQFTLQILRDPAWGAVGVIIAVILAAKPSPQQATRRAYNKKISENLTY